MASAYETNVSLGGCCIGRHYQEESDGPCLSFFIGADCRRFRRLRGGWPDGRAPLLTAWATDSLGIFQCTLQLLGQSGYISPPKGTLQFTQTDSALQMIRLLVSPFGAAILCGTILLAWLFPLTREKYAKIQQLLERRRERLAE